MDVMDDLILWQLPEEPDPAVRMVSDSDGTLWVRKTASLDGARDGWHRTFLELPREPGPGEIMSSAGGRLRISEHGVSWASVLAAGGLLRDVTGTAAPNSLPQ